MSSASTVVQYLKFSGNVCARMSSVISWSDGNVIAFCTDEGLHLMEPSVHAFSIDSSFPIAIQRQFIAAPIQPNVFEFGIDRQKLHLSAPRAQVFELMLDRTLSPAVSCQQSYKGYRQAAWSPIGLGPKESCVLAALTMDHRLTLYACDSGTWVAIAELSQIYYNYLACLDFMMDWMPTTTAAECSVEDSALTELKRKSYATAATQLAWSRTVYCSAAAAAAAAAADDDDDDHGEEGVSSTFSVLATGMKNGSVVLWKVNQFADTSLFPISNSLSIGAVFDSRVGFVRSLCWIDLDGKSSALLIVGGSLGRIVAFEFTISDDVLSVVEALTLWSDEDRLEVTQISYSKVSDDLYNIVAGKGYFIVAWQISLKGVLWQSQVAGTFRQSLIGLFPEEENVFIGASADGVIIKITLALNQSEDDLSLILERTMTSLENEHMNYFGMCPSKNRYMFGLVEGISTWHDHLLIREPFKLLLATCNEISTLLDVTLAEMDLPGAWLHSMADALHAIHYYLLKNKDLPTSLTLLLVEADGESSLQLSTCKLQLTRWLLRMVIFSDQDEEKSKHYKPMLQNVEDLLMERQLLLVLKAAIDQLDTHENLTIETLGSSVAVACQWLRSRPEHHLSDTQKKLLQVVSDQMSLSSTTISETCRLCQKPILFENLHVGKCETGHSFGRCCLTLSICDQPFYRKCRNCSILASCDLFDLLKVIRCPYCSIIL